MSEDRTREEALSEIITRCRSRLIKHTVVLERMLRFVGSHSCNQFNAPQSTLPDDRLESLQDVELFGGYCDETHESYVQLSKHRLEELKELVSRIPQLTTPSDLRDLASLTKLAYQVRRSNSFKQLVACNISKSEKPGIAVPDVRDVVERIGQISKFYRAAVTLTAFLAKLHKLGRGIEIKATSTEKIEISELAFRTAAEVRRRGGDAFTSSGRTQIQNMINRWRAYREHVEIQLIVFYEQNPELTLFSPYIGCNKRSCYLCYKFIAEHGRFQVDGCHQSLYSLWTVRETISFANKERADVFNRALKKLSFDMERKIQAQKGPHWRRPGFSTYNESVANLSRVSLALSDRHIWEPCSEKRAGDVVPILAKSHATVRNRESSVVSSTVDLAPVLEESPEEVTVARVNCEPSSSDTVLPDESVDTAHRTSYSQVERDFVAPQPRPCIESIVPTPSIQADPAPAQELPGISVAWSGLHASAAPEDIPRQDLDPQVPDRPRRKHRRHKHRDHQTRHLRPSQQDPRPTGRSKKSGDPTADRVVTKKHGKRSSSSQAKSHEQRKSQSSRSRVMRQRGRKRRSSLRQRFVGMIRAILGAWGGFGKQKPRRRERPISRGQRVA